MSKALLLKRSPLSYPGGNPGFDPNHMAAGSVGGLSAVARGSGGGAINLLTGKGPSSITVGGSALDSRIGPVGIFAGSSDTKFPYSTFPAAPVCFGMIAILTGAGAFFASSNGAQGVHVVSTSNILNFGFLAGGATNTGLSIPLNTPLFIAASSNGSVTNAVVLNLQTGKVISSAIPITVTPTIGITNFQIGADWNGPNGNANIAATMFTSVFLSIPQLLQWAQDPWGFWYP